MVEKNCQYENYACLPKVSRALKLFDPSETDVESIEELDKYEEDFEDAELFFEVETDPPVLFGEGGRNLDSVYAGHQPKSYGLALRPWVFGKDALAEDLIMPQRRSTRASAPKEKVLKFLSKCLT